MTQSLHQRKNSFFQWVMQQPEQKKVNHGCGWASCAFDEWISQLKDLFNYDRKNASPEDLTDVNYTDDCEYDCPVFNTICKTNCGITTYRGLMNLIVKHNPDLKIYHPDTKRMIWRSFKEWLQQHPPEKETDTVILAYFDGSGDSGQIETIYIEGDPSCGETIEKIPLLEPIELKRWEKTEKLCFKRAFEEAFIDPMIEKIPFDWCNNEGGYGEIRWRFNDDETVLFDIAYDGYRRYEESTNEWYKAFDDD